MRARERGRLVESIVREQLNSLVKQSEFTASDVPSGLPRGKDSIALERWLILKTLNASGDKDKFGNFQHLASLLRSLSHEVPNGLRPSVDRWANTCESWADTLAHKEMNLWTITVLSEFVEKYPYHPEIPEALYMLGDSYLDLGTGLPNQVKADRVLNLCSELYPDSVWASRANTVWQEQYSPQNMSGENRKSLAGLNHAI